MNTRCPLNGIAIVSSRQLSIRNACGDVLHQVSMDVGMELWRESMVWSGAQSYLQGEDHDAYLILTWRNFSYPDSHTCETHTSYLRSSYLIPESSYFNLALRTKLIPTSYLIPEAGSRFCYLS